MRSWLLCVLLLFAARLAPAADCSASATSVMFGVYDTSLATPTDSTGSLTVSCSYTPSGGASTVLYTVGLSSGNGSTAAQRWLASGADRLYYNLYTDAARLIIWGDGTAGSTLVSGSLKPGPGVGNATRTEDYTVYGRIPARQDVDAGDYRDTIVFTLTF
jgi:spore coat protein U-like protein